jgi:hypothetical protein
MKRRAFIKYVHANNCILHHEGSNHSIYINIKTGVKTSIPRHSDIDEELCQAICKQLGIPKNSPPR